MNGNYIDIEACANDYADMFGGPASDYYDRFSDIDDAIDDVINSGIVDSVEAAVYYLNEEADEDVGISLGERDAIAV